MLRKVNNFFFVFQGHTQQSKSNGTGGYLGQIENVCL